MTMSSLRMKMVGDGYGMNDGIRYGCDGNENGSQMVIEMTI